MTEERGPNWGRWGPDDQRGMLNLITPEHALKAARLIRRGAVYNLAVPLGPGERIYPGFQETWRVTYWGENRSQTGAGDDIVVLVSHAGTHIDALSHFWSDGKLWNGRDVDAISPSGGVTWANIQQVGSIVTRGVMADVARFRGVEHLMPTDAITADELEACLHSEGIEVETGDVLLVRTGWHRVFGRDRTLWDSGEPGPDVACAEWLNAKGVVALGADSPGVEWIPDRAAPLPLHPRALRDYGILLIENLDLEELAADRVYEFFFAASPVPLVNATGAPVVPLALA